VGAVVAVLVVALFLLSTVVGFVVIVREAIRAML
jgi:hypothetical protein